MEPMKNCRIGVYICMCGTNIAKMVDVEAIANFVSGIPNVVLAKTYKYMCSNPGQEMIIQDIKENNLNRVVVAACSPNMHERTFRNALRSAGLNQYLFEMANIREQCSWVHKDPVVRPQSVKGLSRRFIQSGRQMYRSRSESPSAGKTSEPVRTYAA